MKRFSKEVLDALTEACQDDDTVLVRSTTLLLLIESAREVEESSDYSIDYDGP